MTDILKVENVTLTFGGVKAITDISFNVREGEICAVIGPNGAGKSSMLNVINGVYLPQIGTVTYDGVEKEEQLIQEMPRLLEWIELSKTLHYFKA